MTEPRDRKKYNEVQFRPFSAWPMVFGLPTVIGFMVWNAVRTEAEPAILGAVVVSLACCVMMAGFFIVTPNMSRVLVLFGKYRGTVRDEGFFWTNPFTVRKAVSVKAHNVSSDTIKVNDSVGNPIEIAAVVVWQVHDTAQAVFDVENYRSYVNIQIETAVRQLASRYPYDRGLTTVDGPTLRDSVDEVSEELQRAIQTRLELAGITVIESRISHLAYAAEIASAMLQRQQASAIIAARAQIVDGAVGMVEHALELLGEKDVVDLDDERKATLVGNLLVVLCGHSNPTPVVNTGSLYN